MTMPSSDQPLVSIISVFYNRERWVSETIDCLLGQDYKNIEVIICDDGSSDGTLAELEKYKDPRLKVISHENRGFVATIREAVAQSSGEFIAIHGSGDLSYHNRISEQVRLFEGQDVGVVGCHVADFDVEFSQAHRTTDIDSADFHELMLTRNPLTHGCVMFRRSIYEQVGGYRTFFTFAQDRDLWLRMSRISRLAIAQKTLYERRRPEGSVSASPRKILLQAYLSEFAVQCAHHHNKHGIDLLTQHGPQGALLRARSSQLSKKLATVGLQWAALRQESDGKLLVVSALNEDRNLKSALGHFLLRGDKPSLLWKMLAKPLLSRYLRTRAAKRIQRSKLPINNRPADIR